MRTERSLDQLFLRPAGAGTEALMVFESFTGARTRERLLFPGREPVEVVEQLARHLARDASVTDVAGVRLRRETAGRLADDTALKARLVAAYARAYDT